MDHVDTADAATARSALSKAAWHTLPLIVLAYLVAYIDRVNISFAAATMNVDRGFSATIYGLGGGLFFLGYALFEVPSSMMLERFGARRWIARIMITWGLIGVGMMFVQTPWQFYAMRFLLGVAEAGFFPGAVFYLSHWFPRAQHGRILSRLFIASPLAAIVMGALSGWLLSLDGRAGLQGWQWLFLVQGTPSVIVGFVVLWLLPDTPALVSWLSPAEKTWLVAALDADDRRIGEPPVHGVFAAMGNMRVFLLGLIGVFVIGANTSFLLSTPAILAAKTGLDVTQVGYLVALGGVTGVIGLVIGGWISDRIDRFVACVGGYIVIAAAVFAIALTSSPVVAIVGYLLFAASCFTILLLCVTIWTDVLHSRQLAVGSAAINTMSQIGGFAAPFAWGAAKDATGNFQAGLFALPVAYLAAAGVVLLLRVHVRNRAMAGRAVTA